MKFASVTTGLPVCSSISLRVLPDGDAPQTLVDPLLGVALLFVEFLHAAHGQFGILDPVDAFLAHPCQPALEWLGLGTGDGLDQPEDTRSVPALHLLSTARSFEHERKGGTNCPPPSGVASKAGSLLRIFFQYSEGFAESVKAAMMSVMTNHHSSSCSVRRIARFWKSATRASCLLLVSVTRASPSLTILRPHSLSGRMLPARTFPRAQGTRIGIFRQPYSAEQVILAPNAAEWCAYRRTDTGLDTRRGRR